MRIGTWNLEGRWSPDHERMLVERDCDLWLLTEVADGTRLQGYASVTTKAPMQPGKAWAAVLSRRPIEALPDPHPASAAGRVGDLLVCASVLPWRSSGGDAPWCGSTQGERTVNAVNDLKRIAKAPVVWGGDFNHALQGPEVAGSRDGTARILELLQSCGSAARTVGLAHRLPGVLTIDHIAVPVAWGLESVSHHDARGLSDHDLYVVDVRDH